jgi:outer membrane protein assembly factor BamB
MRASAIRELAASSESTRVAAAFFERRVQIWDLTTRELVKEFETVFGFGGRRLTLDAAGQKCVTASWNKGKRGGVACYEADTGKVVWHRQDLRHTQRVRFCATRNAFWCVPDSGRTRLLDSDNGSDVDSIVGLADLYDSEYSRDLLLEKRNRDYILKNGKARKIPRLTFAILDAVFGPRSLVITESGGPVRCFDSSGTELWRFTPEQGSHFGALWFRKADENFYGVLWNYQQGRFKYLVRLDSATGETKILFDLDSSEDSYCAQLDCIVNSSGAMIDLTEGRLLHRLEFPQKEYPGFPKA